MSDFAQYTTVFDELITYFGEYMPFLTFHPYMLCE
jgi:hypothetical protein